VQDLVPDINMPTPEEAAESAQFLEGVDAALASMPAEWRRARELRSAMASGAKSITVPLNRP